MNVYISWYLLNLHSTFHLDAVAWLCPKGRTFGVWLLGQLVGKGSATVVVTTRAPAANFKAPFVTAKGWGSYSQKKEVNKQVHRLDLKWVR
jgi:hypothetical protein